MKWTVPIYYDSDVNDDNDDYADDDDDDDYDDDNMIICHRSVPRAQPIQQFYSIRISDTQNFTFLCAAN